MAESVVFFDLETSGLDPTRHVIIQMAAVAVDAGWQELESFEAKLSFDPELADPGALKLNSYDPEVWNREARMPVVALGQFAQLLRRHASVELVSKTNRPYRVARLAGHNIATFDMPFLQTAFRALKLFLPAAFIGLDTLQLANWLSYTLPTNHRPKNLKLPTLAAHFGVELEAAHDALADVRANVQVARAMMRALGLNSESSP